MLLPSLPKEPRDLRSNPKVQAPAKIGAGVPLYSVVDRDSPGVSGPFFLDPNVALYWSMLVKISEADRCPIQESHLVEEAKLGQILTTSEQSVIKDFTSDRSPNPFILAPGVFDQKILGAGCMVDKTPKLKIPRDYLRGNIVKDWFFHSGKVLLEIQSNEDLVFENKLLDADISIYVNYKFGRHDLHVSKRNVNTSDVKGLNTMSEVLRNYGNENSWIKKCAPDISAYQMLTMLDSWVFSEHGSVQTDAGTVDYSQSLKTFQQSNVQYNKHRSEMGTHPFQQITEIAYRIIAPQQLFETRKLHDVDWEKVWLVFITLRASSRASSPAQLRSVFSQITGFYGNNAPNYQMPTLHTPAVLQIIKHCSTIKDAIAFLSTSRFYRFSVLQQFSIQQLLFMKFLPTWNEFFTVIPHQSFPERLFILGLPKKEEAESAGLWKAGCVFFMEDLPEIQEGQSFLNTSIKDHQSLSAPDPKEEKLSSAEEQAVRDKVKKIPTKKATRRRALQGQVQQNVLAQSLELDVDELPKLQLHYRDILPLIRACNSFLALMTMIKTGCFCGENKSNVLAESVTTIFNYSDDHGPHHVSQSRMARPPLSALNNTTVSILSGRPTATYADAVGKISVVGSWIYPLVSPFFLEPSFGSKIDRLRTQLLHRGHSYQYPLDEPEIPNIFSELVFYDELDQPAAIMLFHEGLSHSVTLEGNHIERKLPAIYFAFSFDLLRSEELTTALSELTADLWNQTYANIYQSHERFIGCRALTDDDEESPQILASVLPEGSMLLDSILTMDCSWQTFCHGTRGQKVPLASCFYTDYMVASIVIRRLIHQVGITKVKWHSNL